MHKCLICHQVLISFSFTSIFLEGPKAFSYGSFVVALRIREGSSIVMEVIRTVFIIIFIL